MHPKRLRFSDLYYCYIISHLQGPYQLQNAISRVYGSHYKSQTVWRSPHVYNGRNHYTNKTVCSHYGDVIMSTMASQITSLASVYSTFYSGADQRKHQSSASLAFVRGIHRAPVNSPHKWPVTRKMFPFDDVIMWIEVQKTSCSVDGIPMKQWFRIRGIYFVP